MESRYAPYVDKAIAVLNNALYIGSANSTNGTEVWRMLLTTNLPLIIKH